MRGASDPAWRRYYADVARAHLRFREGHISSLELRRKIEAARRYANRTQKEES